MIMFGIKTASSSTPYRGYYDHSLGKIVFYVDYTTSTLLGSAITTL